MKTKNIAPILGIVIVTALAVIFFNDPKQTAQSPSSGSNHVDSRIISMAPSITEILFALGLGDRVIGVSQYCDYPAQAAEKPKFGGLLNPSYEAIVAAEPDLVITFEEMLEPGNKFASLGIETLVVKHQTLEDILESIIIIGQSCGAKHIAERLVAQLRERIAKISGSGQNRPARSVLICIGHSISQDPTESLKNIYIAGDDGFYSEMLKIIGAKNAYSGKSAFPKVGYESLIAMDADIIIDIMPLSGGERISRENILAQWKNFSDIEAVKNDRIYILSEKYMAIPGPRFILTLEKIAAAVNNGTIEAGQIE